MHIFGSERGPLASPTRCGTYPVSSTFTPWDSSLAAQTSTQYFTIESGPEGTAVPGSDAPLLPDLPGRLRQPHTRRPRSLLARSHALGRRPEPRRAHGDAPRRASRRRSPGFPTAPSRRSPGSPPPPTRDSPSWQSPSCPPASQIGTAVAGAGAGTHPVYLPGKVYLAGPYKGAPLASLASITPAVSGPYDLGNVAVRAALARRPDRPPR